MPVPLIMILGGFEPPTSALQTYALPAATASEYFFKIALMEQRKRIKSMRAICVYDNEWFTICGSSSVDKVLVIE